MVNTEQEQLRLLEQRLRGAGVDRRTFLKIAGAALAAPAAGSLLAACGDDDDEPEATTAPEQPDPTATEEPAEEETEEEEDEEEAPEPTATEAPAEETEEEDDEEPEPTATEEPEEDDEEPAATGQYLLDYGFTNDPASHDVNANLYCGGVFSIWAGLLGFDENFAVVPEMAESWEPNEDATMWTFHLRPNNGGFSNGDDVTAETFAFSWRRLLTPATAAPYASILYDIQNAQEINLEDADPMTLGVRAVDDWTLEVDMIGPRGMFPTIVAYAAAVPCHPESATANPDTWTNPNFVDEVVSNGPFKLTVWEHNQVVEVVRNDNYFGAADIQLEHIIMPITPVEQGMLPYEVGDRDWDIVPGPDLTRVQQDPVLSEELIRYVYPGIWYMVPEVDKEPFDMLEVRTAVSHSIDRDRVVDVTNGQGQPMTSLMPPGLFAHFNDDEISNIQRYDPELAMAALEGTPYEGGTNWPEIILSLRSEAHNSQIMAEDLAAQMNETLNMDVKIDVMEQAAFRDAMWNRGLQLIFIRWFHDYPDPNNLYFDIFYSNRDTGLRQAWSNEEFDALTILGKEQVDPAERFETYHQAEMLLQTERAYIPVTYRVTYYLFKPWVEGLPVNMQGATVPNSNIYLSMWNSISTANRPA